VGAFLLPTLFFPTLSSAADVPKAAVLWVMTGAGLPFLVVLALGKGPARVSSTRTWAARSAVAFVVVAAIATLLSKAPLSSLVGEYLSMTGLIFFAGLAACWALATGISVADRRLVENAIIWAGTLNAAVAFFERFPGLGGIGLPMYGGTQPAGLLGNPVYFGGLLAATLALLATRVVERPALWAPVTAVVAFGAAICGERLPVLVAVGVIAWSIWALHRRDEVGLYDRETRDRAILYGAVGAGGLVTGSVIPGAGSVAHHVAASTTSETFGQRIGGWLAGFHALVAHPLFGYGPDQYEAATVPHYSVAFARTTAQAFFSDAHNMFVEVAVVTGVLGLIAFVAFLFFALRDRGGPLVVFAVAIMVGEMAEPLFVGLTSLAFLALGAAAIRRQPDTATEPPSVDVRQRGAPPDPAPQTAPDAYPRWALASALALAGIAFVAGVLLIVGDVAQQRMAAQLTPATASAAIADGTTANSLLRAWPTSASTLAFAYYFSGTRKHSEAATAAHFAAEAVQRDPTDAKSWLILATFQFAAGEDESARRSALRAMAVNPVLTASMNLLADIAALDGDRSAEHTYLERSLLYDPQQPIDREYLSGACHPEVVTTQFGGRTVTAKCTRH
jgi:O-antigen ligase